ncbi:hypothetical protein H8959_001514 [Pygathrix nigripes]
MFDRNTKRDVTLEASRESSKPRAVLKPRRVCVGGKRRRDDISVDSLDFTKKILHTAWHPAENIIAIAATNNLYIFQDKCVLLQGPELMGAASPPGLTGPRSGLQGQMTNLKRASQGVFWLYMGQFALSQS